MTTCRTVSPIVTHVWRYRTRCLQCSSIYRRYFVERRKQFPLNRFSLGMYVHELCSNHSRTASSIPNEWCHGRITDHNLLYFVINVKLDTVHQNRTLSRLQYSINIHIFFTKYLTSNNYYRKPFPPWYSYFVYEYELRIIDKSNTRHKNDS